MQWLYEIIWGKKHIHSHLLIWSSFKFQYLFSRLRSIFFLEVLFVGPSALGPQCALRAFLHGSSALQGSNAESRPKGPLFPTMSSARSKLMNRIECATQQLPKGFSICMIKGPEVYSSQALVSANGITLRRRYVVIFTKIQKPDPKWPSHISKNTAHSLPKTRQVQWCARNDP